MSGNWGTGIFECFMDPMQCLDTYLCGCCAMSRQWKALEGMTNQLDIVMCFVAYLFGQCVNIMIRMKTVEKYGIAEGLPMTVIWACCFGQCSLCQTHRELTLRNAWPGGTILHKEPGDYTKMK